MASGSVVDPRISTLYEIIGTHFADVFLNHIYNAAVKQVQSRQASSVTDAFRQCAHAYIVSLQRETKAFSDSLTLLHSYVRQHNASRSLHSYTSFVDELANTLIPDEYFPSTTPNDRDEVVSTAISDLVAALGDYATKQDMLPRIIDQRGVQSQAVVTARMLQDSAVSALLTTRNRLLNQFLGQSTKAKDSAPVEMVVKLKAAIRELMGVKIQQGQEIRKLRQALDEEKAENRKLRAASDELVEKYRIKKREVAALSERAAREAEPRSGASASRPSYTTPDVRRSGRQDHADKPATFDPLAHMSSAKVSSAGSAETETPSLGSMLSPAPRPPDNSTAFVGDEDESSGDFVG